MWLLEQTAIISLFVNKWRDYTTETTEMQCDYCEVRTETLSVSHFNILL